MEQVRQRFGFVVSPSVRDFIVRYGVYVSLCALLFLAVFITPDLYGSQTLYLVLRQASQLGLVAIGQTLVMLVAGLDLSVTGVIVMTSIIIAEVGPARTARSCPVWRWRCARRGVLIGVGQRPPDHQAQRAAVRGNPGRAGARPRRHGRAPAASPAARCPTAWAR